MSKSMKIIQPVIDGKMLTRGVSESISPASHKIEKTTSTEKKKRIPKPPMSLETNLVTTFLIPVLNLSEKSSDEEVQEALSGAEDLVSLPIECSRQEAIDHAKILQKLVRKENLLQTEDDTIQVSIAKLRMTARKCSDGRYVLAYPSKNDLKTTGWEAFKVESFRVIIKAMENEGFYQYIGFCRNCKEIFHQRQINSEYCGGACKVAAYRKRKE